MARRIDNVFNYGYGIFDLDGTIVDTMRQCGDIFARLCEPFTNEYDAALAYYYETTGSPMKDQFRDFLGSYGNAPTDTALDRLWAMFNERLDKVPTVAFPRAVETLHALHDQGVLLFLSSASATPTVDKRLGDLGVTPLFRCVLGSTWVPKSEEHISVFAEAVGVPRATFAKDAFFVGDGPTDMRIAKTTGMAPIGVSGTVNDERLVAAGAYRLVPSVASFLSDR